MNEPVKFTRLTWENYLAFAVITFPSCFVLMLLIPNLDFKQRILFSAGLTGGGMCLAHLGEIANNQETRRKMQDKILEDQYRKLSK